MKSAIELVRELRQANPGKRFAIASNFSAIAMWDDAAQAFVSIIEKTIIPAFPWVYTGGSLPLVNGKPVEREWNEIASSVEREGMPSPAVIQCCAGIPMGKRDGISYDSLLKWERKGAVSNGAPFEITLRTEADASNFGSPAREGSTIQGTVGEGRPA